MVAPHRRTPITSAPLRCTLVPSPLQGRPRKKTGNEFDSANVGPIAPEVARVRGEMQSLVPNNELGQSGVDEMTDSSTSRLDRLSRLSRCQTHSCDKLYQPGCEMRPGVHPRLADAGVGGRLGGRGGQIDRQTVLQDGGRRKGVGRTGLGCSGRAVVVSRRGDIRLRGGPF